VVLLSSTAHFAQPPVLVTCPHNRFASYRRSSFIRNLEYGNPSEPCSNQLTPGYWGGPPRARWRVLPGSLRIMQRFGRLLSRTAKNFSYRLRQISPQLFPEPAATVGLGEYPTNYCPSERTSFFPQSIVPASIQFLPTGYLGGI
jgi:hypothetical protein